MELFMSTSKKMFNEILTFLDVLEDKLVPLYQYIKEGTIVRDLNDEVYRGRVEYTKELRRIVYNPGLFNEILLNPELKEKFFRAFGYKGNLEFTLYPNSWIRDLALENYDIGEDVYMADGIVLGTNSVTVCQKKLKVGPICIGDRTIFDQGCKIGLKTKIGKDCTFSVNCSIGLVCKIGNNVKVSPASTIMHFTRIEDNVIIGGNCFIGEKAVIKEGANIGANTVIPPRSIVEKNGNTLLSE
jgi:acetyltransferase-like isoleucine patch superfamily enzyme